MGPWCSGWARGVVEGPYGVVDGPCVCWMGPWWSGWARGVVDVPVEWMDLCVVDGLMM